jgi:ABC-type antimicrobial peptide transport system ATPase subunit
MKVGNARLPVSIDTGSDGAVELFGDAVSVPTVKRALAEVGTTKETGARGGYTAKVYRLSAPISLGPFVLPAGQSVTFIGNGGSAKTRLANVGNRLLASMQVKLLLNYRDSRIVFFGDCSK